MQKFYFICSLGSQLLSHLSMQGLQQLTWVSVPLVVVSKEQKHLVGGQLLLNDIIPVDGHDGHADEKVEVICLGGREWVQIRPLTQP